MLNMQVYVQQEMTFRKCLMHHLCGHLSLHQVYERNLDLHIHSILMSLISMTAPEQKCQLRIDRDRWRRKETCLWSWALFWDHRWSVTCSRCYWLNFQVLGPNPQMTAVCKQERQRGNCRHDYISRSNSCQMNSTPTSTLYTLWLNYNLRELPVRD